jgi:hypothetical protein
MNGLSQLLGILFRARFHAELFVVTVTGEYDYRKLISSIGRKESRDRLLRLKEKIRNVVRETRALATIGCGPLFDGRCLFVTDPRIRERDCGLGTMAAELASYPEVLWGYQAGAFQGWNGRRAPLF